MRLSVAPPPPFQTPSLSTSTRNKEKRGAVLCVARCIRKHSYAKRASSFLYHRSCVLGKKTIVIFCSCSSERRGNSGALLLLLLPLSFCIVVDPRRTFLYGSGLRYWLFLEKVLLLVCKTFPARCLSWEEKKEQHWSEARAIRENTREKKREKKDALHMRTVLYLDTI